MGPKPKRKIDESRSTETEAASSLLTLGALERHNNGIDPLAALGAVVGGALSNIAGSLSASIRSVIGDSIFGTDTVSSVNSPVPPSHTSSGSSDSFRVGRRTADPRGTDSDYSESDI